eukprot:scaffold3099_cov100-Isochrysis_galbana.AAC.3
MSSRRHHKVGSGSQPTCDGGPKQELQTKRGEGRAVYQLSSSKTRTSSLAGCEYGGRTCDTVPQRRVALAAVSALAWAVDDASCIGVCAGVWVYVLAIATCHAWTG